MSKIQYRAVQFIKKEEARLVELEVEDTPLEDDEIAGRTLVSLISPGTETFGLYTACFDGANEKSYPMGVGYAAVFEAQAVGQSVRDIQVGDIVFAAGNHRSFQRIRRQDAVPVPRGLAPEIAVFSRFAKICMPTYARTRIMPPETVYVTGLGIVGLMAAQLARIYGYEAVGCDPSESRRAIAEEHGIRACEKVPDFSSKPEHERPGLGIDCSGHEMAVLDLCQAMHVYGEVNMIGVPWKPRTDMLAQTILRTVFYRYIHLQSGWEGQMPDNPRIHSNNYHIAKALQWLAHGKLIVKESAYELASPQDPQRYYQDILHGRSKRLSVVFDWNKLSV